MSTLQMLDVALGMIFVFLLLSLVCTALNEIIEAIFKYRATDLETGIRQLLNDKTNDGKVAKLYNHPLISSLYTGTFKSRSRDLPSYIPARNFALALMDLLLPAGKDNLSGSNGGGTIPESGTPDAARPKSLAPLRESVLNWPEPNSRQAILALVDAAGNDVDKARENFESWYNSSMDRIAGWYKRRAQTWLIIFGFLAALAMNADTLAIFKSLVNDPPLRNSLVSAAQEFAAKNDAGAETAAQRVDANVKKLYSLRLPIGWDWDKDSLDENYLNNYKMAIPYGDGIDLFKRWLLKITGLLITAFAVSLGSAFWFDTLNKIMVIRSTVKPREKSIEESSEDRQRTLNKK